MSWVGATVMPPDIRVAPPAGPSPWAESDGLNFCALMFPGLPGTPSKDLEKPVPTLTWGVVLR